MLRKLTKKDYINRLPPDYKLLYDYSKTIFNGMQNKITFICLVCNRDITKRADKHLLGHGCICNGHGIVRDLFSFIFKAKQKHQNGYRYDKSIYTDSKTKLIITCNKCNKNTNITPSNHLVGHGCHHCNPKKTYGLDGFITKATNIFKNKEYSYSEFINSSTEIPINCNLCGNIFYKKPADHLMGQGCPCQFVIKNHNKSYKNIQTLLYYFRLPNGLYKIGITKQKKVSFRHHGEKFELIGLWTFENGDNAVKIEKNILSSPRVNSLKYEHKLYGKVLKHGGDSELFTEDILSEVEKQVSIIEEKMKK